MKRIIVDYSNGETPEMGWNRIFYSIQELREGGWLSDAVIRVIHESHSLDLTMTFKAGERHHITVQEINPTNRNYTGCVLRFGENYFMSCCEANSPLYGQTAELLRTMYSNFEEFTCNFDFVALELPLDPQDYSQDDWIAIKDVLQEIEVGKYH